MKSLAHYLLFPIPIICLVYVLLSRSSERFIELVFGSVGFALVIGVLTSIVFVRYQRWAEGSSPAVTTREWKAVLGVFSLVPIGLAVLIWSSNTPRELRRDILVTYVASVTDQNLATTLGRTQSTAITSFDQVATIFEQFRDMNPDNSKAINDLLDADPAVGPPQITWRVVRDLTEYSTASFIATQFTNNEIQIAAHRGESSRWLGFPHPTIKGDSKGLGDITGEFQDNLFYGIVPDHWKNQLRLNLPKGSRISVVRDSWNESRFIIENNYVKLTVGVRVLSNDFGRFVLLQADDKRNIYPFASTSPHRRYHAVVFFDASYSRLRYGFTDMKYYEQWANDLLAVLERKFGWANPAVTEPPDS